MKAGQFVAALRQVPKEYSSILSSLQDQVGITNLIAANISFLVRDCIGVSN